MPATSMAAFILAMASAYWLDADNALGDIQVLHHSLDTAENEVGILDEAAVIRGDIGLTLSTVDQQGIDLVQILGCELHRGGEAGTAQTYQTAGTNGILEGLQVSD